MTDNEHVTPTDDEIDEIVVSQADDQAAWDEPFDVKPRRRWHVKPSRLELAAKFHVLSALNRLGVEASLIVGERDDVDIAVIREPGRAITAQVKALVGTTRWRVEELRARKDHYVVFVCYVRELHNPLVPPEVFVLASDTLRGELAERAAEIVSLDEVGERLQGREAWHRLVAASAA